MFFLIVNKKKKISKIVILIKNWRMQTDYRFGLKMENGELNPTFFPSKHNTHKVSPIS